jgi:ABC-type sugar transport system ATPase subunit
MTATLLRAEPEAPPLLAVGGLSVAFGPVRALSEVDLRITPGELVALAGKASRSTRCSAAS